MAVILVSSDAPETARQISAGVARRLAYRALGREFLAEVARTRSIDEGKLIKSLERFTGLMGLSEELRRRYLAHLQETVLAELVKGDVVCHGLEAHLYVSDVSHVLKVRILVDVDVAAREMVEREGIPVEKARKAVEREAARKRRWSKAAFGLDASEPSLYDLAIKIHQIGVERAVEIVADAARDPGFRPTTYSRKRLADLLLESRARSALIVAFPGVRVQARDGRLVVQVTALKRQRRKRTSSIQDLVAGIPGVESLHVEIVDDDLAAAAESLR